MATQAEINQIALDNRTFINSLITKSKLPSELANKTSITSANDVAVIQNGLSDAEKSGVALTRGSLGSWNASSNDPSLVDGTGVGGDKYLVGVAGTQDFGSGAISFLVDDFVEYINGKWKQTKNRKLLSNRVIVTQASDFGVVDSTKEYFLDGIIDMSGISIEVPSGGISIQGYNLEISGLTSSENNYTMFTSPIGGSGDFLAMDVFFTTSGTTSKVYDLVADTGGEAHEISRVNYTNCTSVGEIDGYRQGLESGTGRFGGTPNLILSGSWAGGYFIDVSIVRGLTDGAYALYEEGTSFLMESRFRSNQNIDLNATVAFVDFNTANFTNPSTLQLQGCQVTRNGVSDSSDTTIIPNITAADLKSDWIINNGIPNTFVGGQNDITTEVETTISVAGTFVDLAGTYTTSELQHFDSPANGQLRHLGDSPREYTFTSQFVLSTSANDEVDLRIVIFRDATTSFEDGRTIRRVINNLIGGRDVAYYVLESNIILNKNDYVKLQVANTAATSNITAELNSYFQVGARR